MIDKKHREVEISKPTKIKRHQIGKPTVRIKNRNSHILSSQFSNHCIFKFQMKLFEEKTSRRTVQKHFPR